MNDSAVRRTALFIVGAVVIVIALNLLARSLDDAVGGREPGGASGSSYATQEAGLAAYTRLLVRYDHPVRRIRGDVEGVTLDPADTVIVVAPAVPLSDGEGEVLRDFAERGGRLVLAGVSTAEAARVLDDPPRLRDGAARYDTFAESLSQLREVSTNGDRAYDQSADATTLVRRGDRVLAMSHRVGAGDVVSLADPSLLTNDLIGYDDNAALALELAGAERRRVVFAEGVHGYGEATGIAAVPTRWKYALAGFAIAAITYAWARGRRLGPADRPLRALPPARAQYVDALASTLARSREPAAALGSLAISTRVATARRAGLPPDASREAVDDAARALGLDDDEIEMLWREPRTDAQILALGRAAARVTDGRTSR